MIVNTPVLKKPAVILAIGFLILLISFPQTSAQETILEDTRDVSVKIGDPVFLTWTSPVSLEFLVKATDVENVDVRRDISSLNFTFHRQGFYFVLASISATEPKDDIQIFLGRVNNQENRALGSYLLSGGASLDLTLRITVRDQSSNTYLPSIGPDESSSPLGDTVRLAALIAPLAYLGGFIALDVSNYLRRKNTARPRAMPSYKKWTIARYAIVGTIAIVVIFVTMTV